MRRFAWVLILAAALLAACGGNTPAADAPTPAEQPTEVFQARVATEAPSAAPATAAPTEAPSAVPATAAPTAQLILPPTAVPTPAPQAAQPTAKPAAQPAAQPAAPPPPAPARAVGPTRIVIDDIGVDYRPVSVGLDKQRVPIVPDHDVGWYNLSSGPGEGENIVLWGHVLRFRNAPNIPAPFAHVKDLKPGASIVLYDGDGNPHRYVIKQQVWVKPDEVEYILPKGKEMVTMVSCIGDKVISNGEVVDESHRLITIAEPA
jgi:LPXTG-site transpeptidase (sortase) family protein